MGDVIVSRNDRVATVRLDRGKVHALNESLVDELRRCLQELLTDTETRVIVLTGTGKFFSFGMDIPELYDYSPEEYTRYCENFCTLYTDLFLCPKPTIAAINGHAVAAGCVLTLACDYRIMVTGRAKTGLNEVTFGASLFAGAIEMLQHCVGDHNAEMIVTGGKFYSAEEALESGLVDHVSSPESFDEDVLKQAQTYAATDAVAFANLKTSLRGPRGESMIKREPDSIRDFVTIWYSPSTREQTKDITIR